MHTQQFPYGAITIYLTVLLYHAVITTAQCNGHHQHQPTTRIYCIAAVERLWNYAPQSTAYAYDISGLYESYAQEELQEHNKNLGKSYMKVMYRGFAYDTQTMQCDWMKELVDGYDNKGSLLGLLGPTIRAVVGDTIVVHFRNNASHTHSVHPHGLYYQEGFSDSALPGKEVTYTWLALAGSGPDSSSSMSSRVWLYYSNVDGERDTNSGLLGAIIVTSSEFIRSQDASADAVPCDVDLDIVLAMMLESNLISHIGDEVFLDPERYAQDEQFVKSNTRYSLNGYLYGNLGLGVRAGTHVRWHMISIGGNYSERVLGLEWARQAESGGYGQAFARVSLQHPGYISVDMIPQGPAGYFLHAQDRNISQRGMVALLEVIESLDDDETGVDTTGGAGVVFNWWSVALIGSALVVVTGALFCSIILVAPSCMSLKCLRGMKMPVVQWVEIPGDSQHGDLDRDSEDGRIDAWRNGSDWDDDDDDEVVLGSWGGMGQAPVIDSYRYHREPDERE